MTPAYQLSTPLRFADPFDGAAAQAWFHILALGSYFMPDGQALQFERDNLGRMVELFNRYSTPCSIDYDHQTVAASHKSGPIETAGYVTRLELRDDGIWGLGKFTQKATDLIRAGSYGFCSPVIQSNVIDRKSGEVEPLQLFNVALTVNPYQDGLTPIVLSKDITMKKDDKSGCVTAAKPIEGEPVVVKADTAGDTKPADIGEAQGKKPSLLAAIAQGVGVDEATVTGLIQDNLDKIIAILKGDSVENKAGTAVMSKELDIKEAQLIALSKRVEALESEKAAVIAQKAEADKIALAKKIDTRVDELLSTGYLLPEQKQDAIDIYAVDWDKGERLFSKVKVVPIGDKQAKTDPKTAMPRIDSLSKSQLDAVNILKNIKIHGRPMYTNDAALVAAIGEMNT